MIVLRVAAFIAGVGLVAWAVRHAALRDAKEGEDNLRLDALIVVATVGVTAFALADYAVARLGHEEFIGLATRTDALYFAVSTLATVGFGDIHAQGQLARALVLTQMVFNVAVLAAAFALLRTAAARRRRQTPPST